MKGSVFDCFMVTRINVGAVLLSIATSVKDRCTSGSNEACNGTVNSPQRKNPKNARQHAAHMVRLS